MSDYMIIDGTPIKITQDKRTASSGKTYSYCRSTVPIGNDPETGRQHFRSYRGATPEEVRSAIEQDKYSEGFHNIQPAISSEITIQTLIELYVQSVFPRFADNTLVAKKTRLSYIRRYAGDLPLNALDVPRLLVFQGQLLYEEKISAGQINLTMSEFHQLFRFAQGENIPVCDPFHYFSPLSVSHKVYTLPTLEQLKNFQKNLTTYGTYGNLINADIFLGLRICEMQALRQEDICGHFLQINKHIVQVNDGNGLRNKLIPHRKMNDTYTTTCPDSALKHLNSAISRQDSHRSRNNTEWNPSHFIFVDENGFPTKGNKIRQIVQKVGLSAGIADFTPHSLRRVLAYHIFQRTSDIRMVQTQLGHAIPYSSALYILNNVSARPSPCRLALRLERKVKYGSDYTPS